MSHLIPDDLFDELMKDTKIEVGDKKLQINMDVEAIDISR